MPAACPSSGLLAARGSQTPGGSEGDSAHGEDAACTSPRTPQSPTAPSQCLAGPGPQAQGPSTRSVPRPAEHWTPDELLTGRCELTCGRRLHSPERSPHKALTTACHVGTLGSRQPLEATASYFFNMPFLDRGACCRPQCPEKATELPGGATASSLAGPPCRSRGVTVSFPAGSLHRPRQGHCAVPWAGGPGPASWTWVGSAADCCGLVEVASRQQVPGCHRVCLSSAPLLLQASRQGVEKPQGKATCRSSPQPS